MPASHHSIFYIPDVFPDAQPTVSKHLRHGKTAIKMEEVEDR